MIKRTPKKHRDALRRFLLKVAYTAEGCWEWQGAFRPGRVCHGRFKLAGKSRYAHRLALAWHRGLDSDDELPEGVVRHRCNNSKCVNPKHLRMGTVAQNNQDIVRSGRHVASHGLKNGNGKLSDETVRELRECKKSIEEIAESQRVTIKYLRLVLSGRRRKAA